MTIPNVVFKAFISPSDKFHRKLIFPSLLNNRISKRRTCARLLNGVIIAFSGGKYKRKRGGCHVPGPASPGRTCLPRKKKRVRSANPLHGKFSLYYLPIKAHAYCGFSSASFLKIVFFCAMAACAAARRAIGTRNGEQDT